MQWLNVQGKYWSYLWGPIMPLQIETKSENIDNEKATNFLYKIIMLVHVVSSLGISKLKYISLK